jgi:hypothetical protein
VVDISDDAELLATNGYDDGLQRATAISRVVVAARNCSAGARGVCGAFAKKSGGVVACLWWRLGSERDG